jgi:hypothetical protein
MLRARRASTSTLDRAWMGSTDTAMASPRRVEVQSSPAWTCSGLARLPGRNGHELSQRTAMKELVEREGLEPSTPAL